MYGMSVKCFTELFCLKDDKSLIPVLDSRRQTQYTLTVTY